MNARGTMAPTNSQANEATILLVNIQLRKNRDVRALLNAGLAKFV